VFKSEFPSWTARRVCPRVVLPGESKGPAFQFTRAVDRRQGAA